MASATETGFEVAQYRVDPTELWQILGFVATHDDGLVLVAGVGHPSKTSQPVGNHPATGAEVSFGPIADRLARETGSRRHFGVQRMPLGVERDCRDKRHFVLGASSGFSAGEFAAEIGIIHLN